jgi:molybdopterin-guanine dinucleotide biosynthesis protein A
MGVDKALLQIDGPPLAARAAAALQEAGATEVRSIGGDLTALRGLGLDARADDHPGEGPLGGVLTGFAVTTAPVVVVLACDLPGAAARSVRAVVVTLDQAPQAAAAVPIVDGRAQWLHAAYRRSSLPVLRDAFAAGERSIAVAAGRLEIVPVPDLEAATLADVDGPGDLPQAASTLSPRGRDEEEQA